MRTELTFYPSTGTPIELSFDEARELYLELFKVFGPKGEATAMSQLVKTVAASK